uniref:UBA-like domain-containing protein n=1 Tax=Tetranychus urticae TaxID=32264 RepID=T1KSE0_TETUR
MDTLREQVMINQFVSVAGCNHDQAKKMLKNNNWQFQRALSIFFQESPVVGLNPSGRYNPLTTPANTPATPPNFPETLLAFSKFTTSPEIDANNKSNVNVDNDINDNTVNYNSNNNKPLNHLQFNSHLYGVSKIQPQFNHHHHHNVNNANSFTDNGSPAPAALTLDGTSKIQLKELV